MINQAYIHWDPRISQSHYTHAIEAVGVNGLQLHAIRATAAPAHPNMATVLLHHARI